MVERPRSLTWSHWPLKGRPLMAILLIAILILVSSLVFYWLAWSWQAVLLLVAFFFSLRDFLFARTVLIDEQGLTVSHPLTGARHTDWSALGTLQLREDRLIAQPRRGRLVVVPAPNGEALDLLRDWQNWQGARGWEEE
jgi:uncharacterized integral membrane protein